mgnify:CR=1 FL=1
MNNTFDPVQKPTILVVDDTPENLSLMSALLKKNYRVRVANSGEKALSAVRQSSQPDLILLDIMMPGMSGYEVCESLKQDPATRKIPIIFLTALNAPDEQKKGLELGAADYITKPINPPILMARVKTQLENKAVADFLRDQAEFLTAEVDRQTKHIAAVQEVTIQALASLAETRDNDTGNHIRRTQFYVLALAQQLKNHPRFSRLLNSENIDLIYRSAPLHDIGKVGIPDRILLKPGSLTAQEFEIMKTHTSLGKNAIEKAESTLSAEISFLKFAKEIAYCHQEKWDGSGYPQGLKGDEIPIAARLMAVADVYDALISDRVYKKRVPHEKAVAIIQQGSGIHFDPTVVEAFMVITDKFREISHRYSDCNGSIKTDDKLLQMICG